MLEIIVKAIWLMLPAYISNPMAVVFGGGIPIDFGKNWSDGRRILGDGKTIRGLIAGTICGIMAGLIQIWVSPLWSLGLLNLKVIIAISLGALLGDIIKSFFKRRLGLARGTSFILVDQLDFVIGAWTLAYAFDPQWFTENFTPEIMVTVLILTPIFHRLTNIFGYRIKLKKEPW